MLPYPGMAPGMMPPGAVPLPVERPPHEERPGSPRQRDYHEEQPRERARRRGKWDEASPDGAAPLPSTAAPLLPASAYTMPPQPGLLMAAAPQMLPQAHLAAGAPPAGYVFNAALMTHALAPQPQPQPRALQQANKKQREIYVGNLLQHVVSAQMIKDFFTQILQSLPSFDPSAGLPVVNVQMSGEGKFAFVELRDETLAATAISLFHDMELCGRKLHIGRPRGYVDPAGALPPGGQQYNALLGAAAAYRPPVAPAPQLYAPQPQQAYAPPMPAVGGYAMPPPQPTHYDPAAAGTPFLCLENLVSAEALRDERECAPPQLPCAATRSPPNLLPPALTA